MFKVLVNCSSLVTISIFEGKKNRSQCLTGFEIGPRRLYSVFIGCDMKIRFIVMEFTCMGSGG